MDWGAYEVFSVISGAVLVIVALLPGIGGKDRLWSFAAGAFFIGYGIFVASRTSGTWLFPVWIFVIPFAAAGYLIYRLATIRRPTEGNASSDPQPSPPTAQSLEAVAHPHADLARARFCSQCGTEAEPGAAYCGNCGTSLGRL